jgi:hypothetical protein
MITTYQLQWHSCVEIALENTIVTTIATNSYNISGFKLQALQQYSYSISDLEL